MSLGSVCAMSRTASAWRLGPSSCSIRPSDQCSSRLPSRLGTRWRPGSAARACGQRTSYFPAALRASPHLSTPQYARIVRGWVREIGLDPAAYGTHTLRRTKASLIYRRTKNLRAVPLLLGHTKVESTVRYLGVEVDDGLEMAEQSVSVTGAPVSGHFGR